MVTNKKATSFEVAFSTPHGTEFEPHYLCFKKIKFVFKWSTLCLRSLLRKYLF